MSETVNYKGFNIEISNDDIGMNPRTDFDNGGRMICFHNRYELGDLDHEFSDPQEVTDYVNSDKVLASLPLFLYDHSGITMSSGAFSCKFDSGQVGVIYITQEGCDKIGYDENWRKTSYSKLTMKEALEKVLEAEVKEYDKHIREGWYSYNIEETDDSCGGFLGIDHEESGLMENAKNSIDCEIQHRIKERIEKVKEYVAQELSQLRQKYQDL